MNACLICNQEFPDRVLVNSRWRTIRGRTNCLNCQPYQANNPVSHLGSEYKGRGRRWSDEQLRESVYRSKTLTEVLRYLRLSLTGTTRKSVMTRIQLLGLDTSHFDVTVARLVGRLKLQTPASEIYRVGSTYAHLRSRVLSDKAIPYLCTECGNTGEHNGKPLSLQLDHINGIPDDNRISNLRFLCPNCHTQTPTWGFKKRQSE